MNLSLYQEELMDHFRYPRNRGMFNNFDFSAEDHNPSCGDQVHMQGKRKGDIVAALRFVGRGCVISQATASMLTEYCCGKSFTEILALTKDDVLQLIGLPLGPNRLKCALLPMQVLQESISLILRQKKS